MVNRFWLGKKRSLEDRIKMSNGHKGKKRKPLLEKTKRKIGSANHKRHKGKHFSPRTEIKKGQHISINTEWKKGHHFPKEVEDRRIKNVIQALYNRPTSFEKKLMEIILENKLNYKYVGNGSFLINYKNPDFINIDKKIAIEVFNSFFKIRDYGTIENYKFYCINKLSKMNWKVLFLDENDIENINWKDICLNKIIEFEKNAT